MRVFATDMFAEVSVELAARPLELGRLIDLIEDVTGITRLGVGREMLCLVQLLQLPSSVAIEVQLATLLALTKARAVSLWMLWPGGDLRRMGHAGTFDPDALQTRQLARRLLGGKPADPQRDGTLAGVIVERRQQSPAVLVARGQVRMSAEQTSLLEAAVPMLTAMLEREDLLTRERGSEDAVLAATERRLARVRFDLHDGPQQDVIMLADDLALFRTQFESIADDHPHGERLLGRLEDLRARLVALDGDLRRISVAVQSPFLRDESLEDALAQITDDFTARTCVAPETKLRGDFSEVTDSQHIALLGLIRESLSNVREHSDAEHVTITLSADVGGIEVTVTDDGRGFDPEATLVRAAREGHLGLVGMHERIRLLGGCTQIDSRPGGPTVISISLPRAAAVAPLHAG